MFALIAAALHLGISAGVGNSHDLAGLRLEARLDHFALTAALGPSLLLTDAETGRHMPSASFGARWYFGDDGDRFFVSAQESFLTDPTCTGPCGDPETVAYVDHTNFLSVTAGWRFKWSAFFLEAGAGGGVMSENGARAGLTRFSDPVLWPDVTLAVGWEF